MQIQCAPFCSLTLQPVYKDQVQSLRLKEQSYQKINSKLWVSPHSMIKRRSEDSFISKPAGKPPLYFNFKCLSATNKDYTSVWSLRTSGSWPYDHCIIFVKCDLVALVNISLLPLNAKTTSV